MKLLHIWSSIFISVGSLLDSRGEGTKAQSQVAGQSVVSGQGGGFAQQIAPIGVVTEIARSGALASKAAVASEAYIGMLACEDCGGIRVELSLYREGSSASGTATAIQVRPSTYHLRQTFYGNFNDNTVLDTNGTWREFVDERQHGVVVELLNRGRSGMRFLARATKNEGTLVVLDDALKELPADLPHMLVQNSGDRQDHLTMLTEADNDQTVEMQPGEVFLMRLRNDVKSGYSWTSNRPRSMALVETGGPEGAQPAPIVREAATLAISSGDASGRTAGSSARRGSTPRKQMMIHIINNYSVWEMIAPVAGIQELQFEYRNAAKPLDPPMKIVRVSVVVH